MANFFSFSIVYAQTNEEHFFENYKQDTLKEYFYTQGLKVERPLWRKLNLINKDQKFFRKNIEHPLELKHDLQGLIFEVSKVRDSDVFEISIEKVNGEKEVYHNVREILYENPQAGSYNLQLNSDVFEQLRLKIFEADRIYPNSGILLLNDHDADFSQYENKIDAFISRGGTLVNLGSKRIHELVLAKGLSMEEIILEGEDTSIQHGDGYYFYIPRQLFLNEETAARVLDVLKTKLGIAASSEQADTSTMISLVLLFLVIITAYKKREHLKEWLSESLYPLMKKLATWGILIAVLLVVLLPLFIFWYKNYSGLDLFPNLTIDQIINTFHLKILAKLILLFIAFIVIFFALLVALVDKKENWPGKIKNKILNINIKRKAQGRDTLVFLTVAVIAVGLLVSSFFFRSEIEENGYPVKVYSSYIDQTLKDNHEVEVVSSIPLVYKIDEFTEEKIVDTFPSQQSIETILTSQTGNGTTTKTVYADSRHLQYFGYFNKQINGEIKLRNKNKEFANKDLYVHLVSLDGKHKTTINMRAEESLLGTKSDIKAYPLRLSIPSPGIYGIKIKNSDPFNKGDYEVVSINANTDALYSLNEIIRNPITHQFSLNLGEAENFLVEPYQIEKVNKKAFWVNLHWL